nr:MBL fold metallo-hydrolase [Nocardia sp. BMG111209]
MSCSRTAIRSRCRAGGCTPGHTPGHLCLREPDARVLLTGDCVLPRITPNLGLRQDGASPLPQFFDSLRRLADYDDHEALPAHEYRFGGMALRSEQLLDHHDRRCREIVAAVEAIGDPTIWQLAERLTWSRPWAEVGRMQVAALAETMAHVVYLVDRGELAWSTPGGLFGGVPPARLCLGRTRISRPRGRR